MIDWDPTIEALRRALAKTFRQFPPDRTVVGRAIWREFEPLAFEVVVTALRNTDDLLLPPGADENPNFNDPSAVAHTWETRLDVLHACLLRSFNTVGPGRAGEAMEISDKFERLVSKMRTKVSQATGSAWPALGLVWKEASVATEQISNEVAVSVRRPSPATLNYFSSEYNTANLRMLRQIGKSRAAGRSPDFSALLAKRVSEMRFGIRVERMLAASTNGQSAAACRRLCYWARKKHQEMNGGELLPFNGLTATPIAGLAALTSGLPCLLEPTHAEEFIALLRLRPHGSAGCIPSAVALWLGESGIEVLRHFISAAHHTPIRNSWVSALGLVGGHEVSRMVGDLLISENDESLIQSALNAIEQLASTPSCFVCLQEDRPDQRIEDTVNRVLARLAALKKRDIVAEHRVSTVEAKVQAYLRPADV